MRLFSRVKSVLALVLVGVCVVELLLAVLGSKGINKDLPQEGRLFHTESSGKRKSTRTQTSEHKQSAGASNGGETGATPLKDKQVPLAGNATNNTASYMYNLVDIIANLSRPWISNKTRKAGTWSKLNNVMDARKFTVLTKNFTEAGQNLTFAINVQVTHNLTQEIYRMLPEQSPFANLMLKSCSVVGNAGILSNSHCGQEIDSSDFVIRYKRLSSIGHRTKFLRDMKAYGDLLIPVYGVNLNAYKTSLLALQLLQQKGSSTRALIINPDHFRALQNMWKELGLKSRMTTGFYLASVVLSVCQSVDLYGFWPFAVGIDHRPVAYHYYDKLKITKGVHNFNWEFDVLYQLHMNGVLRMHAGPCR